MEPQPSTSKTAAASPSNGTAREDEDGPTSAEEVEEAVSSTSGSARGQDEQREERLSFTYLRASVKECHQLFGASCRVKLHRCDEVPTPGPDESNATPSSSSDAPADSRTVAKVKMEKESDTESSSSSSSEDEQKLFPTSPAAHVTKKPPAPTLGTGNNVTTVATLSSSDALAEDSITIAKIKVEEESETESSSSSSSEDEVKSPPTRRAKSAVNLSPRKLVEYTDSETSSSSSSEDDLKVFAVPPAAPLTKKRFLPTLAAKHNAATGTRSCTRLPADLRAHLKVEKTSDSSSSEEEQVKVFPAPSAAPSTKKKRAVTKKNEGKRVAQPKSSVQCRVCKKRMCSNSYLKVHMRKHTGAKGHKCENCGRSFWSPSLFAYHKKRRDEQNGVCPRQNKKHDGEWRPKGSWNCKICGNRMKYASYYGVHMRSHRGEKLFKCGECGKAFVTRCNLSHHMRIHTQAWQYSCVFCERTFHFKHNLFNHLRGHTEEKPYFCVVEGCGASFQHPTTLQTHRRLIHLKKY